MATGDRIMDGGAATPEDAAEDDAEVQTKRFKAAVPPRPVTLPPRPAGPGSLRPNAAPLTRLSEGPPRDRHENGQAAIPPAPRLPAGPPPLPPLTGLASARPRAAPPPPPQRPSVPPLPRSPSSGSTPAPPAVNASLAARAAEDRARAALLQSQLHEAKQALTARDSELREARAECARLRGELAEREADKQSLLALAKIEAELRVRTAELERTSVDLSSRLAESENGLGRAESRLQELEQELATSRVRLRADASEAARFEAPALRVEPEVPAPAASGPVQVSPEDNLKKIRGIGPKFERALKAAGVRTYAQIAALGDEGVRDLARTLRISADRIRREGWVERARELGARAGAARNSG